MKKIKNEILSIVRYVIKNKYRLGVFIFSFIILVAGTFFINFFIMLIIALLINLIWFIPYLIQVKHVDFSKFKPIKKEKEVIISDFNEKNNDYEEMAKHANSNENDEALTMNNIESSDNMKRIRRTKERKVR